MNKNDALLERYEEFRQRALGQPAGGIMGGLAVFRTKGMTSWARTWQVYAEEVVPYKPVKESVSSAPFLSAASDDVVRVLAGMVWSLRKEVHDG